jgi:hypothetical protein
VPTQHLEQFGFLCACPVDRLAVIPFERFKFLDFRFRQGRRPRLNRILESRFAQRLLEFQGAFSGLVAPRLEHGFRGLER